MSTPSFQESHISQIPAVRLLQQLGWDLFREVTNKHDEEAFELALDRAFYLELEKLCPGWRIIKQRLESVDL